MSSKTNTTITFSFEDKAAPLHGYLLAKTLGLTQSPQWHGGPAADKFYEDHSTEDLVDLICDALIDSRREAGDLRNKLAQSERRIEYDNETLAMYKDGRLEREIKRGLARQELLDLALKISLEDEAKRAC